MEREKLKVSLTQIPNKILMELLRLNLCSVLIFPILI